MGTAIALLARARKHEPVDAVRFRHFWGRDKLGDIESATGDSPAKYVLTAPTVRMGVTFAASKVDQDYFGWPLLTALFPVFPGSQDEPRRCAGRHRSRASGRADGTLLRYVVDRRRGGDVKPVAHGRLQQVPAANRRRAQLNRGFLPEKSCGTAIDRSTTDGSTGSPRLIYSTARGRTISRTLYQEHLAGDATDATPRLVPASSDHAARVPRPDGPKRKSRSRPPEFGNRSRRPARLPTRIHEEPHTRVVGLHRRSVRRRVRIAASRRRCTLRSGIRQ